MKLFCLILALGTALAFPESKRAVPAYSFGELLDALKPENANILDDFKKTSKEIGAFIITDLPDERMYIKALKDLQFNTKTCFDATESKKISLQVAPAVMRSTSAVSSQDDTSTHPECVEASAAVITNTLDSVGKLMHKLISKLSGKDAHYKLEEASAAIPLSHSHTLDHLHLYTSMPEASSQPTAALHTDNGLFLVATPAKEAPLHVQSANGDMLTTFSPEHPGVIVLYGRALDQWLLKGSSSESMFRPAPHSVPPMKADKQRVIFARMYVLPSEALPISRMSPKFHDFFMEQDQPKSALCPRGSYMSSAHHWRQARSLACEEGTVYCWMSCLPVDPTCPPSEQQCYSADHKPCCTEGQTADDGCEDMDVTCAWHCS